MLVIKGMGAVVAPRQHPVLIRLGKHWSIRTPKTEPVFARAQAERVPLGHSKSANDTNASGTYSDGRRPARRAKRMDALRNAGSRENRPVPSGLRLQTGQTALLVVHLE